MYLFILLTIISIIITIGCFLIESYSYIQKDLTDKLIDCFCTLVFSFIILNLFGFAGSAIFVGNKGDDAAPEVVSTFPIIAFETTNNTTAAFILGSGTIEQEQSFFYIEKTPKGNQLKTIVNNNTVFIKEDNTVSPNISKINEKKIVPKKYKKWSYVNSLTKGPYTVITIPTGSIKYEYNLKLHDLK